MIIPTYHMRCDGCGRRAPERMFVSDRDDRQKVRQYGRKFGWKRIPNRDDRGSNTGQGKDLCPSCAPNFPDAR